MNEECMQSLADFGELKLHARRRLEVLDEIERRLPNHDTGDLLGQCVELVQLARGALAGQLDMIEIAQASVQRADEMEAAVAKVSAQNSHILNAWERQNFKIETKLEEWMAGGQPRRGTN